MLPETIDVRIRGESGLQAEVLRLEDERMGLGREEDLVGARARNVERERRGRVREFNLGRLEIQVRVRRGPC